MPSYVTYLLIATGLLLIAGLSLFIWKQLKFQRDHRQRQQALEQQAAEKAQQQRDYLIESIRVLSQAMETDEKLTLTEGCIRIKVLLESLAPHLLRQEPYDIFVLIFEQTQHIPIKEQWQKLDKTQQRRYIREMRKLENQHQEQILSAARAIHSYAFDRH
ncbi:DUF2489 domain-containing protein [Marinobacterium arenosum]|uniref:DUF2489 domain-containing protein n=1 Tax=Marinobacterium arenosum TaxID=2862496 RepID=UPI001C98CBA2|nr:DUF2489 domain-containing protein [Marinobacterium arenosum]MBY4677555.1 DUF2489 domain-containing protein [Marinobacterium arenosum]